MEAVTRDAQALAGESLDTFSLGLRESVDLSTLPENLRELAESSLVEFASMWGVSVQSDKPLKTAVMQINRPGGEYHPSSGLIRTSPFDTANNIIHEVAHWLDDKFLGPVRGSFSSAELDTLEMKNLMGEVKKTKSLKELMAAVRRNKGKKGRVPDQLREWAKPYEVFARIIEQATAYKAGRNPPNYGDLGPYARWTKEELEAIMPHVETLLGRLDNGRSQPGDRSTPRGDDRRGGEGLDGKGIRTASRDNASTLPGRGDIEISTNSLARSDRTAWTRSLSRLVSRPGPSRKHDAP